MFKAIATIVGALAICAQAFALTTTSSFKMYRSMYPKVSPNCDTHTLMTLKEEGGVVKEVTLTEKVSGVCEIFVAPNIRTYQLEVDAKVVDGGCKSVYYVAQVHDDLTVKLTDNRKRACEHPVPNTLVISEKDYEGMGKTLYSLDQY